MQIRVMDEAVASEAAAFYEIGMEVENRVIEYTENLKEGEQPRKRELIKQIAAIINLAFSCELFLKSGLDDDERIQKENQVHKLKTLFEKQQPEFQQLVKGGVIELRKKSISNYDEEMFDNELQSNSEVFFKWRYYYEGKVTELNMEFIRVFSLVLFTIYEKQLEALFKEKQN